MDAMQATMPVAGNEPMYDYAPGSPARAELRARLDSLYQDHLDVPARIAGVEVRTGTLRSITCPHEHAHQLGSYHQMNAAELDRAIRAAEAAREDWSRLPFEQRAAVFLRAAELAAGTHRATLNAATMLGQSKNVQQAEIDAAAELVDFFRFNVQFAEQLLRMQPRSGPGKWNRLELRPLDGFVLAVSPFNFTSIAANLAAAPALMGNTVVWKPSSSAVYPAHFIMDLLEAAGLPPGVINLVPAPSALVDRVVLSDPRLGGLHFTGSSQTFNAMWQTIAHHLPSYGRYPRIVGETGGKDFVFMHASAPVDAVATALVRGSFEYQGQKCSAASRAYVPRSRWPALRLALEERLDRIHMGDVLDFSAFVNAVIDRPAFDRILGVLAEACASSEAEVIYGGLGDASRGYFVEPTVIRVDNPHFRTMEEEIFGPVLSVFVYADEDLDETLALCRDTSPYALTGSVFATDRRFIHRASELLRQAAGNLYINDKPTGAVVGQQPFGGSRASGTNDKAGSPFNLMRWTSPRTVSETFAPPTEPEYPHMAQD